MRDASKLCIFNKLHTLSTSLAFDHYPKIRAFSNILILLSKSNLLSSIKKPFSLVTGIKLK